MRVARTHVDLFSGIGGFSLACEWAGVETIAFSEIDPYATRVLKRHWPNVRNYGDVRNVPAINGVWLVTGGFPCQPFSSAGQRRGKEDDRHLWPEMVAAIKRIRPTWVLGENVAGIIGMELDSILADLESEDYAAQAFVIPACALNALHRRDRVWICAYAGHHNRSTEYEQQQKERSEVTNRSSTVIADSERDEDNRLSKRGLWPITRAGDKREIGCNSASERLPNWAGGTMGQPSPLTEFERPSGREVERDFRGVAHGVSRRVDRLRTLGNAIVPQVAYQLIKRMIEAEEMK